MALIRILLILLLLGTGTLLVWQNQGLFVVRLLGSQMQPLPLGILLVSSILLGFVVGILLLFLLRRKTSTSAKAARRFQSRKTKPKNNFFRSPFKSNPFKPDSPQSKAPRSKSSYSAPQAASDWDEAPATDWAGTSSSGAAPDSGARSRRESYREEDRDPYPNRAAADFDEQSDAFVPSRKETPRERVVDADYRVLRQPHAPPPSDEDWDDEFFREDR
jgi:uncharacterized integral membrane protein